LKNKNRQQIKEQGVVSSSNHSNVGIKAFNFYLNSSKSIVLKDYFAPTIKMLHAVPSSKSKGTNVFVVSFIS
jgi:hypothetical protein